MSKIRHNRTGGVLGKYLLLIGFICLLIGYFLWKEGYGKIGSVVPMPKSTAGFLAFIRDVNGETNLFLTDSAGKDIPQRTNDGAAKRAPAWSPDGKQLCYSGEPKNPGPEGRTFQLMLIGEGDPKPLTYGS